MQSQSQGQRDIAEDSSSPVTTLRRRCISCFCGVIVRRIYAPLKLISANNKPGREVTKGARSLARDDGTVRHVGGRSPDTASGWEIAAAIFVHTLHSTLRSLTIGAPAMYCVRPGLFLAARHSRRAPEANPTSPIVRTEIYIRINDNEHTWIRA